MKEFVTAVKEAHDPDDMDEGLTVSIDGHILRYYKPTDGQVAVYFASSGRHAATNERVSAVINFFVEMFAKEDQPYLVDRLLDRDDPFGIDNVQEILEAMIEEWSGRPTPPSSVSTPSRTNGGRKSTRTTPALT